MTTNGMKAGPARAGEVDVSAALVGMAMLVWASEWRPGSEVAVWRIAITAELTLVEVEEFFGPGRAHRLTGGILRVASIARQQIAREV